MEMAVGTAAVIGVSLVISVAANMILNNGKTVEVAHLECTPQLTDLQVLQNALAIEQLKKKQGL